MQDLTEYEIDIWKVRKSKKERRWKDLKSKDGKESDLTAGMHPEGLAIEFLVTEPG